MACGEFNGVTIQAKVSAIARVLDNSIAYRQSNWGPDSTTQRSLLKLEHLIM